MTDITTEQLALTTLASIGDTIDHEEAAAILGVTADDVRALILTAVIAHGEREGRADYEERASDVARGAEAPEWAWPLAGADDAYLNAVGVGQICCEIGIDASQWEDVSAAWLAAFVRGYEAAAA